MVQRSGHSTCGYHSWSPRHTCRTISVLLSVNGNRLSPEPACRSFGFFLLKQFQCFGTCCKVAGGLVVHARTAQRRGLHATRISLATSSDVPAILFLFDFNLSVWQGAKPRTPKHELYNKFTIQFLDQCLSHAAQGLFGISFPDVKELARKTNLSDRPMRTPYDIRSFKCVCAYACSTDIDQVKYADQVAGAERMEALNCRADHTKRFGILSLQELVAFGDEVGGPRGIVHLVS